jgi:hypothetical protein
MAPRPGSIHHQWTAGPARPRYGYDVDSGGDRFLMLKPVPRDARPPDLHVILNWFEELRRLAPLPE